MFKHLISKIFKKSEHFTITHTQKKSRSSILSEFVFAPIATDNREHEKVPPLFTEDGNRLLFIDPHLSDKELKEIYGDALNNQH